MEIDSLNLFPVWTSKGHKMINEEEFIRHMHSSSSREEAFTILVREYQESLYWLIRRMVLSHEDADDILQNTFLKAWSAMDTFRGESKIGTWLFRIAVNESLNFLEKKKRTACVVLPDRDVENLLLSDQYFDGDVIQAKLQRAIRTLPEKQRAVFNLKYFQEMKYEEMSRVMDTSVGALKASYHHAVKKITEFLKQHD